MENATKIIEINGVKMEVDLRTAQATNVEKFKVGDTVKVLVEEYSGQYKSFVGVIVGFDEFPTRPTIVVAYIKNEYSSTSIEMAYIHEDNKKVEICAINKYDIPFTKESILNTINQAIEKTENELRGLIQRREYFLKVFGKLFKCAIEGPEKSA